MSLAVAPNGNVTLLSRHKEAKRVVPAMCVERITEKSRWNLSKVEKCQFYPYGWRCSSKAQFIAYAIGTKTGRAYCGDCLPEALKGRLERPAGEAERLEAEKLERQRVAQEVKDAAKAHEDAGLCTGRSKLNKYRLCERAPVVTCECWRGKDERLCARHAVRCRKHHPEKVRAILRAATTRTQDEGSDN